MLLQRGSVLDTLQQPGFSKSLKQSLAAQGENSLAVVHCIDVTQASTAPHNLT